MTKDAALLVIDAQNFFFEPGVAYQGQDILERIRCLIIQARSAGVPVVYIQHDDVSEVDPLSPGTHRWMIHADIAPSAGEPVIRKKYPDSFMETSLREELERRNVRKLVVCGFQTEFCVDTTVRRAFSLGYAITLVSDAHGTLDSHNLRAWQVVEHHNGVLGGWCATLKRTEEVSY